MAAERRRQLPKPTAKGLRIFSILFVFVATVVSIKSSCHAHWWLPVFAKISVIVRKTFAGGLDESKIAAVVGVAGFAVARRRPQR
jgi:4-amino-4-deoxy-L-arabinose transferase-like glycosyltransferase